MYLEYAVIAPWRCVLPFIWRNLNSSIRGWMLKIIVKLSKNWFSDFWKLVHVISLLSTFEEEFGPLFKKVLNIHLHGRFCLKFGEIYSMVPDKKDENVTMSTNFNQKSSLTHKVRWKGDKIFFQSKIGTDPWNKRRAQIYWTSPF